jgi:hypothetical protein
LITDSTLTLFIDLNLAPIFYDKNKDSYREYSEEVASHLKNILEVARQNFEELTKGLEEKDKKGAWEIINEFFNNPVGHKPGCCVVM